MFRGKGLTLSERLSHALNSDTLVSPEVLGVAEIAGPLLATAIRECAKGGNASGKIFLRDLNVLGAVDLSASSITNGPGLPSITIERCAFSGIVSFAGSRLGWLHVSNSSLVKLVLDDMVAESSVRLRGLRPLGKKLSISADRLSARGDLDLRGCTLEAEALGAREFVHNFGYAQVALSFRNAKVGGDVLLEREEDQAFRAVGGVACVGAEIGGELSLAGAQVIAGEADALRAKFCKVGGALLITDHCRFEGRVTIVGSSFGGGAEVKGSQFLPTPMAGQGAVVLQANGTAFGGDFVIGAGVTIKGLMDVAAMRVSGQATISDCELLSTSGAVKPAPALCATACVIDGSLSLGPMLSTEGDLDFSFAKVGGALRWRDLSLRSREEEGAGKQEILFSLENAVVGRSLAAISMKTAGPAKVSLRSTSVNTLDDDVDLGWGDAAVDVQGFVYDRIAERGESGWRSRCDWLIKHAGSRRPFSIQPFTQYAIILARAGSEEESRKVRLRAEALETDADKCVRRLWRRLLEWGFGYGLAPGRALLSIAIFIAVPTGLVSLANRDEWMVVSSSAAKTVFDEQGALGYQLGTGPMSLDTLCGNEINAFVYAADVVIPLVDVREEAKCEFRRDSPLGRSASIIKSLFAVLGWVVTSLVVLTCSGLLRRLQF